jgi:uncharacterized membrane protein YeaQ/YmgE (transglycosylase-associated protein family)
VRFAASPLPFPAARHKEATGFSESLEGIFREPQQGHTRRFTALPVTATWRTMPMVTRYSPRWHANQTRFYFSACEPSPPRPLRPRFLAPGPNNPAGFILTTLLGIAGAFVATLIGQTIGWYSPNRGAGGLGAVVGAVVVLFVWHRLVTNRSIPDPGRRWL